MAKKTKVPTETTPAVSTQEAVAALTNDPNLSPDEFTLGDRTFKIMFLGYDDLLVFMSYLQPFLEALKPAELRAQPVQVPGISVTPTDFDMGTLMRFCAKGLPEMGRIICAQTDPDITVDAVKQLAGDPFTLCALVMRQINKNNIATKFMSFFVPMLTMIQRMRTPHTGSTTKATQP